MKSKNQASKSLYRIPIIFIVNNKNPTKFKAFFNFTLKSRSLQDELNMIS